MKQKPIGKFNIQITNDSFINLILTLRELCWGCNATANLTKAHIIPKHLKPKRNLVIPLCQSCHSIIDCKLNCGCEKCETIIASITKGKMTLQ